MSRLTLVVLACAVAAAVAADAIKPAPVPVPAGSAARSASGSLACPNLRAPGATGRLYIAAAGEAQIRVTFAGERGKPVDSVFRMPGGTTKALAIPPAVRGRASAIVRYAGGPVAAAHTLALRRTRDAGAGIAAGACARAEGSVAAVTQLRTLRATSVLTVFNPGRGRAAVHVSLNADGRPLFPEAWTRRGAGIHLPPLGRVDLRVGDHAFDARRVTAVITATAGRVVTEALVRTQQGATLIGASSPARSLVAASARSGREATFAAGLVGEEDAGLDARFISTTEQGRATRLPASLAPSETARISVPQRNEGAAVAYALDLTVGSPVVAGTTWQRVRAGRRDEAAAEAVAAARNWVAVAPGVGNGLARVLVVNPGPGRAELTVGFPGNLPPRTLEAGRVLPLTIGRGRGVFGFSITASAPVAVFTDVVGSSAGGGWTAGYPATPLRPGDPVAVNADPRVGVPALRQGEAQ